MEQENEKACCEKKPCCKIVIGLVLLATLACSATAMVGAVKANQKVDLVNQKIDRILRAINLPPEQEEKADTRGVDTNEILISKKYDNKGQTLAKALKTKKPVLAFFYVDWCGYCKRFAPTFSKLTKDSTMKKKFSFAYVNCEDAKNSEFVKEYGIQAFPTVYIVDGNDKNQVSNSKLFEDYETLKKDLLD